MFIFLSTQWRVLRVFPPGSNLCLLCSILESFNNTIMSITICIHSNNPGPIPNPKILQKYIPRP